MSMIVPSRQFVLGFYQFACRGFSDLFLRGSPAVKSLLATAAGKRGTIDPLAFSLRGSLARENVGSAQDAHQPPVVPLIERLDADHEAKPSHQAC